MSVTIESTTDSKEAVQAATGSLAKKSEVVEIKSASSEAVETELHDEKGEASDTSATNDEDDTDSSVSDDDEGLKDESKEEGKPKKKGGFQKRIDKLSLEKSKAREEAEYWKNEALKGQKPAEVIPEIKAQAPIEGKPKAESFETHEEYVDALTDWKIDQREKASEIKSKESQVKSEYQKTVQTFQSKVQEFKEKTPDFDETISDVDDIMMSHSVSEAFLQVGPELMYALAKNRKEYERINGLSPLAAARELGKFEASISASKSSEKTIEPKITKAPAPIKPIGSSSAKTGKSPEDMNHQEYAKWRGYK